MRTEPSSAHRAKVLVTPLQVAAATAGTALIRVGGAEVLNLGCAAARSTHRGLRQADRDGWEVTNDPLDTDVIAQVDLPE